MLKGINFTCPKTDQKRCFELIYSMLEIFYMYLFYFSLMFSVHLQVLNWYLIIQNTKDTLCKSPLTLDLPTSWVQNVQNAWKSTLTSPSYDLYSHFCFGQTKSTKKHFPGHYIQSWRKLKELFKDLHRNLVTFLAKMEFKDFSRLCEPWI